ncbi:hypothetical protein GCM10008097_08830 [Mycetocola manganoxydans]|nr:hypothetical protein GCM10008097_08830 [Mycetocola manganoxydans]
MRDQEDECRSQKQGCHDGKIEADQPARVVRQPVETVAEGWEGNDESAENEEHEDRFGSGGDEFERGLGEPLPRTGDLLESGTRNERVVVQQDDDRRDPPHTVERGDPP